jgi:ribonuclease BN (tRNA processing enzyme)
MKLHVLGCGDAFGSGGRNQSGYLFEASHRFFLLDCGPTTLLGMKRGGFDPLALDAIFLSHLHGDHFGGIPFFLIEYLYQSRRARPLHIAGPAGTEERVGALFRLMYSASEWPPVEFHLLEPEQSAFIAGVELFPFRVPHQISDVSLALKAQCDGKQVLFSGDSAWTERFIDEAAGVDLFICECSFYAEGNGNHVRYLSLNVNLPRLTCKRLILTHLGEEMLARRHELAAVCAEDGMTIEF